ncbi:uncharacterized protein [Sagmatias obliquidens]|uniref:Uncharacterized protein LOC109548540 n=1 Tax=Tursiops truncatus TaxID=9739 RepID=A0A2U4AM18_TURTR|nr:uncharacterized protein LOC109548540 [Tursiops truncatus]XP_026972769.1 uncharacterized protein LOC113625990 [Lagenorhynchus obliquidens]XP_059868004.1 uncharacterized protein LOC132425757 [Delphinus delphis]
MSIFLVNTNVPRASVPDGLLSDLTQQLAQAGHGQAGAVHRGARGPGPAPGFRGLQRAVRALQPAQHRQDRRRAEPFRQQAAVTPARQPGQDLHQLLRYERGQRGLERLHLRLHVALRSPLPQARSPHAVFCPPRPQRPHLPGRRNKRMKIMGRATMTKNLTYNRADNFHTYAEMPFIMLKIFLNEPAIIYVKSPENRLMTVLALSLIRHL